MEGATQPQGPAHPDVKVQLSGENGNALHLISRVGGALRRAGHPDVATEFAKAAMQSSSYDEVLQLIMRTVDVH
ncbi:hypothetical protein [Streptomyces sp. NPDC058084]|uniref:hypothetical protein n=1 Tax=Streptomyces sp. NPDC058084 TaxID=3346333 RepID=UPI0036E51783